MSGDGSNVLMKPEFIKALATSVFAGVLDRVMLKEENMTSNFTFGLAVGGASFVGGYIGETIASTVPAGDLYVFSQKSLFQRVVDLTITSGGGFLLNKYAFSNDYNYLDTKRIGVIVLASVAGEYTSDFIGGRALGYLS